MPRDNIEKHLDFLVEKNFCGIRLSSFSPGAVRLDQLEAMAAAHGRSRLGNSHSSNRHRRNY